MFRQSSTTISERRSPINSVVSLTPVQLSDSELPVILQRVVWPAFRPHISRTKESPTIAPPSPFITFLFVLTPRDTCQATQSFRHLYHSFHQDRRRDFPYTMSTVSWKFYMTYCGYTLNYWFSHSFSGSTHCVMGDSRSVRRCAFAGTPRMNPTNVTITHEAYRLSITPRTTPVMLSTSNYWRGCSRENHTHASRYYKRTYWMSRVLNLVHTAFGAYFLSSSGMLILTEICTHSMHGRVHVYGHPQLDDHELYNAYGIVSR